MATQVADLAGANPDIAKAAAVPLVGAPALIWLAGRFGGYKGPLPPSQAYDTLQVGSEANTVCLHCSASHPMLLESHLLLLQWGLITHALPPD